MSVPETKAEAITQGLLHAWWAERVPDRMAVVTPQGALSSIRIGPKSSRSRLAMSMISSRSRRSARYGLRSNFEVRALLDDC